MKKYKVQGTVSDSNDVNKKATLTFELDQSQVEDLIRQYNTKEGKYFFPEFGEYYFVLEPTGHITRELHEQMDGDTKLPLMGVFEKAKDAEKARDRQQAIVAMDKWVQENGIDTNGSDYELMYTVGYDLYNKKFCSFSNMSCLQSFELPYFKSQADCQKFIDACKSLLDKLL